MPNLKSRLLSCGLDYTLILTQENQLVVSGHLPFKVNNTDHLSRFEQLAKFDPTVTVMQIESSVFSSIVVQLPGEQTNELFIWGQTPLGLFE